jgi:hypothetical protein
MRALFAIPLFAIVLIVLPATAQVTCTTLGKFTTCTGPGNQSIIQTDYGNGMGVIIGPRETIPYVTLPVPQAGSRTVPPVFIPTPSASTSYEPTMPLTPGLTMPTDYWAPSYGNGY